MPKLANGLADIKLPEGWFFEPCHDSFALQHPSIRGAVSVFLDRRWWNLGFGYSRSGKDCTGCTSFGTEYSGRGWKQKLVDDAIAALKTSI